MCEGVSAATSGWLCYSARKWGGRVLRWTAWGQLRVETRTSERQAGGEGSPWLHVLFLSKGDPQTRRPRSLPLWVVWGLSVGQLTPGLLVIGQPAIHPMCVKGLCFLTVLSGLAASGEIPVRCEWIHRVRRWFWLTGGRVLFDSSCTLWWFIQMHVLNFIKK